MQNYSIELFYFRTSHAYFLILDPNYLILIFLILDLITSHVTFKITYFLIKINLKSNQVKPDFVKTGHN